MNEIPVKIFKITNGYLIEYYGESFNDCDEEMEKSLIFVDDIDEVISFMKTFYQDVMILAEESYE